MNIRTESALVIKAKRADHVETKYYSKKLKGFKIVSDNDATEDRIINRMTSSVKRAIRHAEESGYTIEIQKLS